MLCWALSLLEFPGKVLAKGHGGGMSKLGMLGSCRHSSKSSESSRRFQKFQEKQLQCSFPHGTQVWVFLGEHSWAVQCSHRAGSGAPAALPHLCPLCWCHPRGLCADGSTPGSHTKPSLMRFPGKSMSEFPRSSRGVGSDGEDLSL